MTEERVALITGSGKGVGAGVARRLARDGIRVCINYHSSRDMAEKTLETILAAGGEAFLWGADVSDADAVRGMVEAVVARWGRLDILVNNAAMQPNMSIDEYDGEKLRWLWEINAGGYWRVTKACLPYLRQSPSPRVILISSIHGKRPAVFDSGYAMTKGAIRMLAREMALELMGDHIPVNCVDLGGCRIEYKTGRAPFHLYHPADTRAPNMPKGCIVTPDEVGALAAFLITPEGASLNGDGIRQDAGCMLY